MPRTTDRHPGSPGNSSRGEASSRCSTATGARSSALPPSCGATKPSSPPARPAGGACAAPGSGSSSRPAPPAERRCSRSRTTRRNCPNTTSTRARWRPAGASASRPATSRAGFCRHDARTIALSISYVRALGRHPRHAPARGRTRDRRSRPRTRRRWSRPPGASAALRSAAAPSPTAPAGQAADGSNARADMPTLLVPSDDRSDGTCAVNDRQRTCSAPAGGRLFLPTLPPLLTTRPGGASNSCARRAYSTTIAKGRPLRTSCCRGGADRNNPLVDESDRGTAG